MMLPTKTFQSFVIIAFLAIILNACSTAQAKKEQEEKSKKPTNVILLIGDGMGLSQVSSAFYYGDKEPNFVRFPFVGLSRTSSASHKITDSAAGATAFSAGKKTYNGAIAVDTDSTSALETLIERYSPKGFHTGIISTSSVTHATPASFYAHVPLRKMEEEIAAQLVKSDLDFVAGGGIDFFVKRKDERNLLQELAQNGFIADTTGLQDNLQASEKYCFLLAPNGMPKMSEGRGDFLPQATLKALSYFSAKKEPFFLMIEGSQIDWGGHANDGDYIVNEVLDFDKAIGQVLDFAEKDGNTLVLVTADHETGGFTLASEEKMVPFRGKQRDYDDLRHGFSTGGHSAAMVPVFAFGPGAQLFAGVYQNTAIHAKITALLDK